jgi:alpha-amylase
MQSIKVILGTYNTMPEGASAGLFELTYQRSWRPFLASLYKFQNIQSVLYYSGTVLEWIRDNHPEFILLLEEMAARKQVELLGGGYYSPLMPLLQPSDKIGQLELLTTFLRKTFGKRPSGGWLYEFAWDSSIPSVFRNAGLIYSFLPAEVFADLGITDGASLAPLLTEDQRKLLYVFPVVDLDGMAGGPRPFEEAFAELMKTYPDSPLYTMMIDGQSVPAMWENSGLESPDVMFERSFAWFQKNCLEFQTLSAQTYCKTIRSGQFFYLASCTSRRFFSAIASTAAEFPGYCVPNLARRYLHEQPEAKMLYDKMYYVHSLTSLLKGDKTRKKSAQEDLFRAQAGDSYWIGPMGGLRRPEVRLAAYRSLIEAEKSTRTHGVFNPGIVMDDIDCDGEREILYQASDLNCYIHEKGGQVFELDILRHRLNLCASCSMKGSRTTHAFIDRACEPGSFGPDASALDSLNYALVERDKSSHRLILSRDFHLQTGGVQHSLGLRKSFLFQKNCLSVDFEIHNISLQQADFRFISEHAIQPGSRVETLDFQLERDHRREVLSEDAGFQASDALFIRLEDGKNELEYRSDLPFVLECRHRMDRLVSPPLRRLHESDMLMNRAGIAPDDDGESLYQGTMLRFAWDIRLPPDSLIRFSLSFHY